MITIGDFVEINDPNNNSGYMISVHGSKGVVIGFRNYTENESNYDDFIGNDNLTVHVKFYSLGEGSWGGLETFWIDPKWLVLEKDVTANPPKYYNIINKIKSMQVKRKAQGYAY